MGQQVLATPGRDLKTMTINDQNEGETTTAEEPGQEESELQERLKRVEYDTLDSDTCRAEILAIEEFGDRVKVCVELPSGRTHSERFTTPQVASDQYELVRLLDSIGYGLSAIDHAVGADIPVRVGDSGMEIVAPEPSKTIGERVRERTPKGAVAALMYTLLILTFPLAGYYALGAWDPGLKRATGFRVAFWFMGSVLWAMTIGLISLAVVDALLGVLF